MIQRRKQKREMHGLKASYTVEAAILMPIVFFVLAALLIAAFYLHDRAVLQAAVCEIVSAGSNMAAEEDQKQAVSGLSKSLTEKRLMGSRNLSGQVKTGETVSAAWKCSYPVPGLAMRYLAGNKLTISVSWKSEKIRPADTIRKIRGFRELISGGAE